MNIGFLSCGDMRDGGQRALTELARDCRQRMWQVVAFTGHTTIEDRAFAQQDIPIAVEALPAWLFTQDPISAWTVFGAAYRLSRQVMRHRLNTLYACSQRAALLAGITMRLLHGRAGWHVQSAGDITGHPHLLRHCVRWNTETHVASPHLNSLLAQQTAGKRVRIIPAWIDAARIALHPPVVRRRGEPPVIGLLGRWTPRNGHEMLVKSIRLLQAGGRRTRVRMAGLARSTEEERYRSMIQSAVKAAGLASLISVEGEVDDATAFLADCDVIALPITGDTTGRVALEAAAVGRPVIASRIPGVQEIVEDGRTGLLTTPGYTHPLADALELLLASPALREEMGRLARERVLEYFTLDRVLDTLEAVFNPNERSTRLIPGVHEVW